MKLNPIPSKRLALLSAALCAAMLAFSHNASAVTDLTSGDGHELGFGVDAFGSPPEPPGPPDVYLATFVVNVLIGMDLNSVVLSQPFDIFRSGNDFGPLPQPAVFAVGGTSTNITIGSGVYSYLFAEYQYEGIGGFHFRAEVWYIGNLSGAITIPGGDSLIGWTLFGTPAVPDGGTTVMLLGVALGALGMARRFLKA